MRRVATVEQDTLAKFRQLVRTLERAAEPRRAGSPFMAMLLKDRGEDLAEALAELMEARQGEKKKRR